MLVENYQQNGVDGRPVVNTSTALTVTISFSLIQILHFEQTQQIITLVGWISLVRARSGRHSSSVIAFCSLILFFYLSFNNCYLSLRYFVLRPFVAFCKFYRYDYDYESF